MIGTCTHAFEKAVYAFGNYTVNKKGRLMFNLAFLSCYLHPYVHSVYGNLMLLIFLISGPTRLLLEHVL